MQPADAPLTPDGDTARGWVEEELSRAEYGHELSPLTRAIRWILQALSDALGGGVARPPVAAILLVVFAVLLVVVIVLVVRNPLRFSHQLSSSAVFDGEERSLEDAQDLEAAAVSQGDWDTAVVWAFRVLVLLLAGSGLLRDTPGLTAREAASQAGDAHPGLRRELMWSADLFDSVRYGDTHATAADHSRVRALQGALLDSRTAEVPTP